MRSRRKQKQSCGDFGYQDNDEINLTDIFDNEHLIDSQTVVRLILYRLGMMMRLNHWWIHRRSSTSQQNLTLTKLYIYISHGTMLLT